MASLRSVSFYAASALKRHPQVVYSSTRSTLFKRNPFQSTRAMTTSAIPTERASEYDRVLRKHKGLNKDLQRMQYAVRGELVLRAQKLTRDLDAGAKLPFSSVTFCNIGNPQSVGQKPISFIRESLAAVVHPALLENDFLAPDVVDRARAFLGTCQSVGAYSESKGIDFVRNRVAKAIEERDGYPSDPESIFLGNGASDAVKAMLQIIIRDSTDGILIPIPQYPLYSATLTALAGQQVDYYLDEDNGWALSIDELKKSLYNAREEGIQVRAIVVINPGNPTGQVLSEENMREIVRFCEAEKLVIMADEVYQKNVYVESKPFISFKKVICDLKSPVELASFHSISKGVIGECGLRGGYVELFNTEQDLNDLVYKVFSVSLCSNVLGQYAIDLMMTPPKEGEESYSVYKRETDDIYNDLKAKAQKLCKGLNTLEGVSCNDSEGAMYLFPQIRLSKKAIETAKQRGYACADVLYCVELLEETGICVVPGSGFGQREGTYHFRTTFLPSREKIDGVVNSMRTFHDQFLRRYS
uniref:Alanine transaminase n=1 Tax=Gracilaria chouae TaxID=1172980 RepID=A0A097IU21_9FLOR|nr:alanine transaminase [Gracilaria chouae]